jgi:hypothetical protein
MSQPPLSLVSRLILAASGLVLLGLVATASRLQPDPRGFGTHEQLGLTPCSFYRWTGFACPTCGATTAWTQVLQGAWAAALQANLTGTLLCFAAVASVPWLLLSASAGRWLVGKPSTRGMLVVGSGLIVIALLDWARRVWF